MKPKKKRNQSPTKIQAEIKTLAKNKNPGKTQDKNQAKIKTLGKKKPRRKHNRQKSRRK
nr:hypothetical protein [Mycoplasmopsis bovis]